MKSINDYIIENNKFTISIDKDAANVLSQIVNELINNTDVNNETIDKVKKDVGLQKFNLMLSELTNALEKL